MTARFFNDSKGKSHYVLMQEFNTSCGPACVAMTEDYYKQACMIDPEGRARELSQKYPDNWTLAGGTTAMQNLSDVLNTEGVLANKAFKISPGTVLAYLMVRVSELTPMIVNIAWTPSGGHYAVCPLVYPDGTAIFLDPWYGLVEVTIGNAPSYTPPGSSGQFSGWVVGTYR